MEREHDAIETFISEAGLWDEVNELMGTDKGMRNIAMEFVYDRHTMETKCFIEKYYGKVAR